MGGQFGANGAMMANAPIERGADLRDGRESDEAEQYRDGDSQHGEDLFFRAPARSRWNRFVERLFR